MSFQVRTATPGDVMALVDLHRAVAAVPDGLARRPEEITRDYVERFLAGISFVAGDPILENLHRSQLNALEEAAAYQQLLDDFGCTHEELSTRIGRSRPQISNTLRLLKLSPAVQRRVAAGVLSAGHARALLGVTDPGAQDRLAARVIAEGISVRGLEEIVAVGDISEDDGETVRFKVNRPTAPGLGDLNERLSDRLDTRVRVTMGKAKGKIAIEFASLGDLERIVGIIDPRNRDDRPI